MTGGRRQQGPLAEVVDLQAQRTRRAQQRRAEEGLTEPQLAVLRRMRSARRRLTTRTS